MLASDPGLSDQEPKETTSRVYDRTCLAARDIRESFSGPFKLSCSGDVAVATHIYLEAMLIHADS